MNLLRNDLHLLTGAYAVGALDGLERERFEHHLKTCQSCSHEVRGLTETATRLAMAAARTPPGRLRDRVLTAAARTRQLPPPIEHRAAHRPRRAARAPWVPRLAVAMAAAASIIALIVLGVSLVSARRQLTAVRTADAGVAAVLSARDARLYTAPTTAGGTATAVVSRRLHQVVFTAADLPRLSGKRVYELWLIGSTIRPAGLLPQPAAGPAPALLAAGVTSGDAVGVTVEPPGGTQAPTTKPIVLLKL